MSDDTNAVGRKRATLGELADPEVAVRSSDVAAETLLTVAELELESS